MGTKLERIAELSKANPNMVFTSIGHLINKELFPEYLGSMGGSPLEPIILMFQNMFAFIDDSVQHIITSQASREILPQLIILLTAMSVLAIALYSKRYIESLVLFIVLCSTAVRGLDSIHGMPAWYVSVMIIIVMADMPRAISREERSDCYRKPKRQIR